MSNLPFIAYFFYAEEEPDEETKKMQQLMGIKGFDTTKVGCTFLIKAPILKDLRQTWKGTKFLTNASLFYSDMQTFPFTCLYFDSDFKRTIS